MYIVGTIVKRLIVGLFSWFHFPVMLGKVVLGVKFSHVKLGSYKKHVILLGVTCFAVLLKHRKCT